MISRLTQASTVLGGALSTHASEWNMWILSNMLKEITMPDKLALLAAMTFNFTGFGLSFLLTARDRQSGITCQI